MSAFVAIKQRERVMLLTDGGAYDTDGVLRSPLLKVIELPDCNAAFTVRGVVGAAPLLAEAFFEFTSLHELVSAAPDIVRQVRETEPGSWELAIVGFTNGPHIYHCAPDTCDVVPVVGSGLLGGPQWSEETARAVGYVPPQTMEEFNPTTHGIAIMEAMRRTPAEIHPGCELGCGVSCFVALTIAAPWGVRTAIIHRWPDVVEERVKQD